MRTRAIPQEGPSSAQSEKPILGGGSYRTIALDRETVMITSGGNSGQLTEKAVAKKKGGSMSRPVLRACELPRKPLWPHAF